MKEPDPKSNDSQSGTPVSDLAQGPVEKSAGPEAGAPSRSPAPLSKARLWQFRIAALLLPLLLVAGVETALRVGGYGYSTSFFLKGRNQGVDVLTDNSKFGRWFFPPALARSAAPFSIPAAKAAGTIRIFVLGESAAMGDPESAFSFSRILEVLLRARYPATRFEVINTGITAINSHAIRSIAFDCARHEGDFWILYMGNNEVVGPYGAGTVFGAETPPLPAIRASMAVKSLRFTQWLQDAWRGLFQNDATRWGGMQMFVKQQVRAEDPRMQRVYSHFQNNLQDVLRAGTNAGAKLIICTVGSNLKDCPPFASLHGPHFDTGRQSEWDTNWAGAIAAESEGRWSDAAALLRTAEQLDPDFAEVQFQLGRCALELGDASGASRRLERARDLDTLRFRADSRMNQILEEAAQGRTNDGIYPFDAAGAIAAQSPNGIPGAEMFYEHVHLTFEGNWVIALGLAEQIARLLPNDSGHVATNSWLGPDECARRLGWDDWSESRALGEIHARLLEPPFVTQTDHKDRLARVDEKLATLKARVIGGGLRQAAEDCRDALVSSPDDPVLHNRYGEILGELGDTAGAIQQWEIVARLLPQRAATYESLGRICFESERPEEAQNYFAKALALDPGSAEAWNGLGLAYAGKGRFTDAIDAFRHGLRIPSPGVTGIRLNLARVLEAAGKPAEAERQYRTALAARPGELETLLALGHLLLAQQRPNDARSILEQAVKSGPRSVDAHLGLGVVLEQSGDAAHAVQQYLEVLKLDPENETAKGRLAVLGKDR